MKGLKMNFTDFMQDNDKDNGVLISCGYDWVGKNIHDPMMRLRKTSANQKDLDAICIGCEILGDISIILDSYGAALFFYKDFFRFDRFNDETSRETIDDIAFCLLAKGNYRAAARYYRKYSAAGGVSFLPFKREPLVPKFRMVSRALDALGLFRPERALKILKKNGSERSMLGMRTRNMAIGALGDVQAYLEGVFEYLEKWNDSLEVQDFYFSPRTVLDNPEFWNKVAQHAESVMLPDYSFENGQSGLSLWRRDGKVSEPELAENLIPFHIARSKNDLEAMKRLPKVEGWYSVQKCLDFYEKNAKMPSWSEFFIPD